MATSDKQNRPYLRLAQAKPGQTVWLDKDFTCHRAGPVTLEADEGRLYFRCDDGQHFLDDQDDGDGCCVGTYSRDVDIR